MDSSHAPRESRHRHEAGSSTSDRISDLSDDFLLAILQHLDSRTAFAAAALSRRWRHLPGSLTTLRLTTDEFLPRPYRELCSHKNSSTETSQEADRSIRAGRPNDEHERQAMRELARCVSDLELHYKTGPDGVKDELRLELYMMHYIWSTPRWLSPGLTYLLVFFGPHIGPRTRGISGPRLQLQSVALNSRFMASLQALSLNDVQLDAECMLHILKNCRQLKSLRLESCYIGSGAHLRIDAPGSELRELVLLECEMKAIELIRAPKLQKLVYSGTALPMSYGSVSCLAQVFLHIENAYVTKRLDLSRILCNNITHIENLALSFAGVKQLYWIETNPLSAPLSRLISLDVSCIPPKCDLLWLSLILEASPFLERLQITATEEGCEATSWKHSEFRHYHLKEFRMIGFVGEAAQMNFVRFVMERSVVLNTVVFVDGLARTVNLWNHKFCIPRWCRSNEEKVAMVKQLKDGCSSTAQIVLR